MRDADRMVRDPRTGRVVVLNGSSSAGKTTLATALQARLEADGACWVIFSWDDFVPRLPNRWHAGPEEVGDHAADGCHYRLLRDGVAPEALLEVGAIGWRMLQGYHRVIATLARTGIDVIVDEVMISQREWDDWAEVLAGLEVRWVAVHCDVDTVERREVERGDRYPGLARGTANVTHRFATYDLEVDTTSRGPLELASHIATALSWT